ncbi:MAG TPA: FeoB-associated Cys-rich membrane protein [Taishania sp.]|nr:FeoB-associated Cys-rich membrane protein [Taishania sp.]
MQVVLVIICVTAAVGYLIYQLVKKFGKKKNTDCGCDKCG